MQCTKTDRQVNKYIDPDVHKSIKIICIHMYTCIFSRILNGVEIYDSFRCPMINNHHKPTAFTHSHTNNSYIDIYTYTCTLNTCV